MRKTLAILLSVVLTFSCVSILGTSVAVAEDVEPLGVNLIESDFHKPMYNATVSGEEQKAMSMWRDNNSNGTDAGVAYLDDNSDGINDFARFTSSSSSRVQLRSYSAVVNPGNTYQVSFKMRIPDTCTTDLANFVVGGKSYKIFPTFALYQPKNNNAAGERTHYGYAPGTTDYAYSLEAEGKVTRRKDFSATWTMGDVSFIRSGYSDSGDLTKSTYYDYCKDADGNVISPKTFFEEWQTITMTFQAIEDAENLGPQVVAFSISMGSGATGVVFDIKDFTFKCTNNNAVTSTLVEGDFDATDGTNWIGYNNNSNVEFNGDYVRVNTSTDFAGNESGLFSQPFTLTTGASYELSFYLRIPEDSNSYMYNGTIFFAPSFMIYEPTLNAAGTKVNAVPSKSDNKQKNNYYAFAFNDSNKEDENGDTSWTRRSTFQIKWTVDGYNPVNKNGYSIFAYSDQKGLLGASTDAKTVYSDWKKITAKFTAVADEEGEQTQVVAFAANFLDMGKNAGYMFDIKDFKLVETKSVFNPLPEITDDIIYFNSFEDASDADKVLVYNYHNNEICDWATKSYKVVKYDGTTGKNALSVRANNQYIFIPVDKALLVPGRSYNFSLDWKLPKNADGDRILSEITFMGYDHDVTVAEGETLTFNGSRKQLAGRVNDKKTLTVTGDWTSFNKYNDVTISQEQYETYEEFGICVSFPTATSGTNEDNTIYLDNIMVKTNPTNGDANGDYDVTLEDVTIMARALAGWGLGDIKVDVNYLDVNNDKTHNLKDLILIAQKAAGWDVELL